jgi:hypothetical protein
VANLKVEIALNTSLGTICQFDTMGIALDLE